MMNEINFTYFDLITIKLKLIRWIVILLLLSLIQYSESREFIISWVLLLNILRDSFVMMNKINKVSFGYDTLWHLIAHFMIYLNFIRLHNATRSIWISLGKGQVKSILIFDVLEFTEKYLFLLFSEKKIAMTVLRFKYLYN